MNVFVPTFSFIILVFSNLKSGYASLSDVVDLSIISNQHGNLSDFYTIVEDTYFGESISYLSTFEDTHSNGYSYMLAVGSPDDSDGGSKCGAIYFLNIEIASGNVIGATKLSQNNQVGIFYTIEDSDKFGFSIAEISSGLIVVGAPGDDDGDTDAGAVYVIKFDNTTYTTIESIQKISNLEGGLSNHTTLSTEASFGNSVALIKNLGGDPTQAYVAIGASNEEASGGDGDGGAVYIMVISLLNYTCLSLQEISAFHGGLSDFYSLEDTDRFGSSICDLGDLSGNSGSGTVLAVGAIYDEDADRQTGAVYLLTINNQSLVVGATKITSVSNGFGNFYSQSRGSFFGSSVAYIDDMNYDGVNDLVVGARGEDSRSGSIYILNLNQSGYVVGASKIADDYGDLSDFVDLGSGVYFGSSVVSLGNIKNEAGSVQIVVGASGSSSAGAVYIASLLQIAPTPTPTVTYKPTLLPTLTSQPTILPTPSPSALPSALPTSLPSLVPSPSPSFSPTMLPTVTCTSGEYFNAELNTCTQCDVGKYAATFNPPYATSCTLCDIGKYASSYGSSYCESCASGKISIPDRSFCEDCAAGHYIQNSSVCVRCVEGTYAPQALDGACIDCGAGFHTNNITGAITCSACSSGSYSLALSYECTSCLPGKWSGTASALCTNCSKGYIAPKAGSSYCTACSAGRYAAQVQLTNCTACSVGKYQSSTGQDSCDDCGISTFTDIEGETSCSRCDSSYGAGYDSIAGASTCSLCKNGYYLDASGTNCVICPTNGNCQSESGIKLVAPEKDHWIDTTNPSYFKASSLVVYACPRGTCKGSDVDESKCWTFENISSCNIDSLQCSEGASGVLCGSCINGYYYSLTTTQCQKCKSSSFVSTGVVGSVILIVILSGLCLHYDIIQIPAFISGFITMVSRYFSSFDAGALKVLFSCYQILQSIVVNFDVVFPSPFSDLMEYLSVLSFDMGGFACAGIGFRDMTLILSAVPLVFAVLTLFVLFFRLYVIEFRSPEKKRSEVKAQHSWVLLLLSYLVLPPLSLLQFQSLNCTEKMGYNQRRYLRVDTKVDCGSAEHQLFVKFDAMVIAAYLTIPFIWIVALYRVRARLNPEGVTETSLIVHMRAGDETLAPLKFLFSTYRIGAEYWDSFEMWRRIVFVGVLPLMSSNSLARSAIGMALSIISMIVYRESNPFIHSKTNKLAYVGQIMIFLVFSGVLLIETELSKKMDNFLFGMMLLTAALSVLMIALFATYLEARRQHTIKQHKLEGRVKKIETKMNLSNTTLFTSLEEDIPPNHCLLYYYASFEECYHCLRGGIPAVPEVNFSSASSSSPSVGGGNNKKKNKNNVDKRGGIVFTLHRPLDLTMSDKHAFENRECCLVVSLPRRILVPINDRIESVVDEEDDDDEEEDEGEPINRDVRDEDGDTKGAKHKRRIIHSEEYHRNGGGHQQQDESGLRLLPIALLRALRGSYCKELVDPTLWKDGYILLPPQCIKQAYQLESSASSPSSRSGLDSPHDSIKKEIEEHKQLSGYSTAGFQHAPFSPSHKLSSHQQHRHHSFDQHTSPYSILKKSINYGSKDKTSPTLSYSPENSKVPFLQRITEKTSMLSPRLSTTTSTTTAGIQRVKSNEEDLENGPPYQSEFNMHSFKHKSIADAEERGVKSRLYDSYAPGKKKLEVIKPAYMSTYLNKMEHIRASCLKCGLVPLYHYTNASLAPSILRNGLHTRTKEEGHGGIYFSTHGPISYGLGSPDYEENLINDCFGKHLLKQYLNKNKLDLVIIYGIEPTVIEEVPGENHTIKVINKSTFADLSLPHADERFYLRPDYIAGAFIICPDQPPKGISSTFIQNHMDDERDRDEDVMVLINNVKKLTSRNELLTKSIYQSIEKIKIEWACGFGANKFTTTFDAVDKHSIASSHALVFYYSTLAEIKKILRSGILASCSSSELFSNGTTSGAISSKKGYTSGGSGSIDDINSKSSSGVATGSASAKKYMEEGMYFTLERPHELTSASMEIFPVREAFVALSLPQCFLFRSKNSKSNHANNGALRYIQFSILRALRSSYFGGVSDPSPWLEGFLLLPPQNIKRAYQLISDEDIVNNNTAAAVTSSSTIATTDGDGLELVSGGGGSCPTLMKKNPNGTLRRVSNIKDVEEHFGSFVDDEVAFDDEEDEEEVGTDFAETETEMNEHVKGKDTGVNDESAIAIHEQSRKKHKRKVKLSQLRIHEHCGVDLYQPQSSTDYLTKLSNIRSLCQHRGLVPLYHYTSSSAAAMILQSGFRMSTQGQGDGGVYFSILSPASYGLGTPDYESNIIIDCYGKERLEEYQHKHKLDIVFIYAMEPSIVEQAPGGRSHAKVVTKTTFEALSLPHADGCFYLRPNYIVGALDLNPSRPNSSDSLSMIHDLDPNDLKNSHVLKMLKREKELDKQNGILLEQYADAALENEHDIQRTINFLRTKSVSRPRRVSVARSLSSLKTGLSTHSNNVEEEENNSPLLFFGNKTSRTANLHISGDNSFESASDSDGGGGSFDRSSGKNADKEGSNTSFKKTNARSSSGNGMTSLMNIVRKRNSDKNSTTVLDKTEDGRKKGHTRHDSFDLKNVTASGINSRSNGRGISFNASHFPTDASPSTQAHSPVNNPISQRNVDDDDQERNVNEEDKAVEGAVLAAFNARGRNETLRYIDNIEEGDERTAGDVVEFEL